MKDDIQDSDEDQPVAPWTKNHLEPKQCRRFWFEPKVDQGVNKNTQFL
jgi:hypothetical protein